MYNVSNEGKPQHHIKMLIESLSTVASPIIKKTITLNYGHDGECFLLHKGFVTISRRNDGLVLNSEVAPFIFGLAALAQPQMDIVIVVSESASLSKITRSDALKIIDDNNLYKSLTYFLNYISIRILNHCIRISQQNSYDTIKLLLVELMKESEEVRNSTQLVSYILNRCVISRSGVMRILAKLREGKYIETEKGSLKSVTKLPVRF